MNKTTINQIISDYIKNNLSPKSAEKEEISNEYEILSKMLVGPNFQSGSYSRFTAITPVNDLDVIWVLPEDSISSFSDVIAKATSEHRSIHPNEIDISNILEELAEKLQSEYKKIGKYPLIKVQTHSVGIYLYGDEDKLSIDLVPAIPSGTKNEYGDDTYWVPEILEISKNQRNLSYQKKTPINWIKSDPSGYKTFAQKLNEKNNFFRKITKFLKGWKLNIKRIDTNFSLKSFHIELIAGEISSKAENSDCLGGLIDFFSSISYYLQEPRFLDRGDKSCYADAYVAKDMTAEEKKKIIAYSEVSLRLLSKLTMANDETMAISILEEILSGKKQSKEGWANQEPITVKRSAKKWLNN